MATKKTNKKGQDAGVIAAEVGAGLLAAAGAAAAGYYFYASENAPKHRRKTAKWAGDMKDNVVKEAKKEMKKVQKLDKKAMAAIVDRAAAAYEGVRNVKRDDLMSAANELKHNWQEIQRELSSGGKTVAKTVKKTGAAKKAPKKATKTASKKVAKKTTKK